MLLFGVTNAPWYVLVALTAVLAASVIALNAVRRRFPPRPGPAVMPEHIWRRLFLLPLLVAPAVYITARQVFETSFIDALYWSLLVEVGGLLLVGWVVFGVGLARLRRRGEGRPPG
jgi:hypothetical protein